MQILHSCMSGALLEFIEVNDEDSLTKAIFGGLNVLGPPNSC